MFACGSSCTAPPSATGMSNLHEPVVKPPLRGFYVSVRASRTAAPRVLTLHPGPVWHIDLTPPRNHKRPPMSSEPL